MKAVAFVFIIFAAMFGALCPIVSFRSYVFGFGIEQEVKWDHVHTYLWHKGDVIKTWETLVDDADSTTLRSQRDSAEAYIKVWKSKKID